jgi:tryptophan-rich sensory protein
MNEPTPSQKPNSSVTETNTNPPSILRCIIGSIVAATMAIASYFMNSSIAQNFADRPIHSANYLVVNITVAVRTLIIGISALAIGVFSIIALGLLALAIQVTIQQLKQQTPSAKN